MAAVEEVMDQAVKAMVNREGKYLTFTMGKEEYGISILKIKEIIGMMPITTVPRTPAFVKGVINLRGKVIPVVDLRLRFGMDALDYNERTCIIVVEITNQSEPVSGAVKMMCFRRFENVCILRGSRALSAATRTGLC